MSAIRKAYCAIKMEPQYRRSAFVQGLEARGFAVQPQHCMGPGRPGDVLVIWNRYGGVHEMATRFEKEGGLVVVAENGYMANDRNNRTRYAIALRAHNGQGAWFTGGSERFTELGLTPAPWRTTGTHVLVTPNRCFGRPGHIMAPNWAQDVAARLRLWTKRPIVVREHPGENKPKVALADALKDCWAMVTWYSSSGVDALLAGVPVFYEAPNWVAQAGGCKDITKIENPPLDDATRLLALNQVAWAQWNIEEIARGTPFQHLLD